MPYLLEQWPPLAKLPWPLWEISSSDAVHFWIHTWLSRKSSALHDVWTVLWHTGWSLQAWDREKPKELKLSPVISNQAIKPRDQKHTCRVWSHRGEALLTLIISKEFAVALILAEMYGLSRALSLYTHVVNPCHCVFTAFATMLNQGKLLMHNTICIYLKARFTLKAWGLPSARTDLCVQQ